MTTDYEFTSASVTEGHPDKLCDRISDAIVDQYLLHDPAARLVAECAVSSGVVFIASRSASEVNIDLAGTARSVIAEAGYTRGEFNDRDCSVMLSQAPLPETAAPRINLSTLADDAVGAISASHQATLFGYACRQTPQLMPLPIVLANRMTRQLAAQRNNGGIGYLAPDAQVQVTIAYEHKQPIAVQAISLLTTQYEAQTPTSAQLRDALMQQVIEPVLGEFGLRLEPTTRIMINPEGVVVGGGPVLHSGMTGRKTGIDTFGDYSRQSGAALSGKDPLRIDRIGAYAARYAAKHVVAAGLADECELLLSYTVGQNRPVSIRVHTYGTGKRDNVEIAQLLQRVFDFRPGVIARDFALQQLPAQRKRFYQDLAVYGQMGREDLDAPWERLDRLEEMQQD